ncbi:hypothetical protein TNCV_2650681 [Trichonephila clavipes]|nr:hypothetical protein TNCV_2650681 [Trichonephila clavipes]
MEKPFFFSGSLVARTYVVSNKNVDSTDFTSSQEFLEVRYLSHDSIPITRQDKLDIAKHWTEREAHSKRDRRVLKRVIMPKNRTTATIVIAELNQHLYSTKSMIKVRRRLHKQNIYGRAKLLVTDANVKCRLK